MEGFYVRAKALQNRTKQMDLVRFLLEKQISQLRFHDCNGNAKCRELLSFFLESLNNQKNVDEMLRRDWKQFEQEFDAYNESIETK
jgi:hypothetical protein